MRILIVVLIVFAGVTEAAAEPERIAFGGSIAPALEGSGPWLMAGVRLSAPMGSRHGLDVETGRVFGGSDPKWGSIRRYTTAQLRFMRPPRDGSAVGRYWLAGLQHLPETEADGRRKHHTGIVIGHGWRQAVRGGGRLLSEVAFAGGDGFLFYVNAGVQWGRPRKTTS